MIIELRDGVWNRRKTREVLGDGQPYLIEVEGKGDAEKQHIGIGGNL